MVVNDTPVVTEVTETQTKEDLLSEGSTSLSSLVGDNNMQQYDIIAVVNHLKTNDRLTVTIEGCEKGVSSTETDGYIRGILMITDEDTQNQCGSDFEITIPKLAANIPTSNQNTIQTDTDLLTVARNILDTYTGRNNMADHDVLSVAQTAQITNPDLTIGVVGIEKSVATTDAQGQIIGTVIVTNTASHTNVNESFTMTIPKLQSAEDLAYIIKDNFSRTSVDNYSVSEVLLEYAESFRTNGNLILSIADDEKLDATTDADGYLRGQIVITDIANNNLQTPVFYNIPITKLPSTTPVTTQPTEQTDIQKLADYVNSSLTGKPVINDVTDSMVNDLVTRAVALKAAWYDLDENQVEVTVNGLQVNTANYAIPGNANCIVKLKDITTGQTASFTLNLSIPVIAEDLAGLAQAVHNNMVSNIVTNDDTQIPLTVDAFSFAQTICSTYGVNGQSLGVTLLNFQKNPATTSSAGSITFDLELENISTGEKVQRPIQLNILQLNSNPVPNSDLDQMATQLKTMLSNIYMNNPVNEAEVQSVVDNNVSRLFIGDCPVTASVSNIEIIAPTSTVDGKVKYHVTLRLLNSVSEIDAYSKFTSSTGTIGDGPTDGETSDELNQLASYIRTEISKGYTTNTLTPELAERYVTFLAQRAYTADVALPVNIDLYNWELVKATENTSGFASFKVDLTMKATGDKKTVDIEMIIPATRDESTGGTIGNGTVDTTDLGKAKNRLTEFLNDYNPSNTTSKELLQANLTTLASSYGVTVEVADFEKIESTSTTAGRCKFNVNLSKVNAVMTISFDKAIAKVTSPSSSSSSSSSHSSSHNSSSIKTDSNSSNNGIPKAISPTNESHKIEIVKAITSNGLVASTPKEVITSSGNRIVVSSLSKDNIFTGAVVTSDKATQATEVSVPSNAKIEGVYKYIPELSKYIKVEDGVGIAEGKVVLPTQQDSTYFVTTQVLPPAETVGTGWAQVNNNWYLIDNTGNPLKGWQNDGKGWTYLAHENSAMKTGWLKDGSAWYYLKDNGYMATGWVKDGDNWYYLKENGSMAADTTVDGYTVDSTGAWVK
ncbi:autolysin [Clostridium beijerinckii]|uniref:Autolysin n=1 Tax=Clostridium beijerinckii TaxID=1520 RepID=A0A1S8RN20_CLOBE|nr:autolysin [Clostridium beijerinckii]